MDDKLRIITPILFNTLLFFEFSIYLFFFCTGSSDSLSQSSQELKRLDTDIAELKSKIEVNFYHLNYDFRFFL